MSLSDREIHAAIKSGELVIVGPDPSHPFVPSTQVQPCSIDLRLGNRFLRFRDDIERFDLQDLGDVLDTMVEEIMADGEPIELPPNGILFGQIYEQLRIPPYCHGYVEGRSRFARLGLSIHVTGGFINPEFEGAMPLQIVNNNAFPIVLYPFISICQLLLMEISSEPLIPYPARSNTPYHQEDQAGPSAIGDDPVLAGDLSFLPNLNQERERRLVENYLEDLRAEDERRRIIAAIQAGTAVAAPNVTVSNSTIGVLSTGPRSEFEASVNLLSEQGNRQKAEALQSLRVAIETSGLGAEQIDQAMEILTALADEQGRAPDSQRASVTRALVEHFETFVKLSDGVAKVWEKWGPVLVSAIG